MLLEKKAVSGVMLTLLLVGPFVLVSNVNASASSVSILWQRDMPGILPSVEVKIADISGHAFSDVIVGAGGGVFAFDSRGHSIWNFSTTEEVTTLLIGDINNDGLDDILALAGTGWSRGPDGYGSANAYLYVINSSGSLLWKRFLSSVYSGGGQQVLAIGDINGDGRNEVVVNGFGKIIAFDFSGNELWSLDLGGPHIGNIKLGDVDGDGIMDVVATYWTNIYSGGVIALNGSGNVLWNYPTQAGMKALAIADVDGDGKNEIVASSYETLGGKQGIYLINGSGSLMWYRQFASETNSIAIGDIDGDGINDIIAGTDGGEICVINGSGSLLWSYSITNTPISDVAVGDFDGDGRKNEVAACGAYYSLNSERSDGTWVFDSSGHVIWEFSGENNFVSLAAGDVNADGMDDVVVSSVDIENMSGAEIYALTSAVRAPKIVTATVDIQPDTLNLKARVEWLTAYIELAKGYNVADINVSTIMLNNTVPAELTPTSIGDYDNDTVPDLMVQFNRTAVSGYIFSEGIETGNVTLTISGQLYDGTMFEGSVIIKVRMAGDVNCDGKVDGKDVTLAALSFGTTPSEPRWNSVADENEDGRIDGKDVVLICMCFGKTYS